MSPPYIFVQLCYAPLHQHQHRGTIAYMDMQEQIARMIAQFSWKPVIENSEKLPPTPSTLVVCGMGGSHLAAELLAREVVDKQFIIHHDYGLPTINFPRDETLFLISSYSGETEETLSAFEAAQKAGLSIAVMTSGGTLLAKARAESLPIIVLPRENIEPRMTLGYMLRGLALLFHDVLLSDTIASVEGLLKNDIARESGAALAEELDDTLPVLYASSHNASLAYILKATFNETAKIPAFWDTFPEACHNELSGYDFGKPFTSVAQKLHSVFLTDTTDHSRVKIRMRFMRELLSERGIGTSTIELPEGQTSLAAGMQAILCGTWAAVFLAERYGVPNARTPIIAAFKEKLSDTL